MATVDEVLSKVDIVDVVGKYIDLQRRGKNYFGVCPFHNDTTPSMSVSQQKQIYKCFSCGAYGNAIDFIINYENLEFKEAFKLLANSVGIQVADYKTEKKASYFDIYSDASNYFNYQLLHNNDYKKYLDYLLDRKFSLEVIEKFKLGVCDNSIISLLQNKYDQNELAKSGLFNDQEQIFLNKRITFPINNIDGLIVGFSGRVIDNHLPKYMNSSENNYFKKGELLYNYANAKKYARKEKQIIITEGFFDVMRLYSIGIKHVVATMGTAFSTKHVKLISDVTTNIYLSFDGDEAGITTSLKVYKMFSNLNVNVYMIDLDKYDPDEFILEHGANAYANKLKVALSYEEYYIKRIFVNYLDLSLANKELVINKATNFVNSLQSPIKQQLVSELVYNLVGITLSNKVTRVAKQSKKVSNKSIAQIYYHQKVNNKERLNKVELEFISLMYHSEYAVTKYSSELKALNLNDDLALIMYEFKQQSRHSDIIEYLNDNNLHSYEAAINQVLALKIAISDEIVDDYILRIMEYKYDLRIEEHRKNIEHVSQSEKIAIMKKISLLTIEKRNITDKRRR